MPISMLEVAKRAGVSQSTVSLVLNGKKVDRIAVATRERVQLAARELGYQPNIVARSLRTQRTNIIGFYSSQGIVTMHDPFFSEIIMGMRIGCSEARKKFLLFGDYSTSSPEEVYAELTEGHVDGLVVHIASNDPLGARLAASSLPVVAIADAVPGLPSVVADDRGGSRMVAEYLAARGHKVVHYRRDTPVDAGDPVSIVRRFKGFVEAASDLGMTVLDDSKNYDPTAHHKPANGRPTAAVCYSDTKAYDLIAECRRHGVRVPNDLAVVGGFDGCHPHAAHLPVLTTIRAGWPNIASKAIALAAALHEGMDAPPETIMPVEFIVGNTA
jgi:LacI family transcriptional regulator